MSGGNYTDSGYIPLAVVRTPVSLGLLIKTGGGITPSVYCTIREMGNSNRLRCRDEESNQRGNEGEWDILPLHYASDR